MNNPAHRQAIQPTGRQSSPQAGNPAHRQAIQPTGRQSSPQAGNHITDWLLTNN